MTTQNSILVRGPLPPLPEPRIAFSPGEGATFDGDRWHLSVQVVVEADDDGERRSFDRTELSEALGHVEESADRVAPSVIVFDGRDWLRDPLTGDVVDRIEGALGRIANAEGAVLVVRTRDDPSEADRDRYAVVIDPTDGSAWRGEPADHPRRLCSHSRDTARRRPSPDP